jgi:hypothetical protein
MKECIETTNILKTVDLELEGQPQTCNMMTLQYVLGRIACRLNCKFSEITKDDILQKFSHVNLSPRQQAYIQACLAVSSNSSLQQPSSLQRQAFSKPSHHHRGLESSWRHLDTLFSGISATDLGS